MLSLQIACINTKCPQISQDTTKNPSCGHLVFILFSQVLKKASASRRQNAPTAPHIVSSHVQWFVRFIRFIRFATSQLSVHSCVPVAHAPVTATLAWHFVPCSLRSHSFTHSFISLFRSFMPACRSRASHRYTRLTLSCHARFACTHSLHRSTHSFRCFVCSLIPLISRQSLFTCFSHMPGSYVGYLHD